MNGIPSFWGTVDVINKLKVKICSRFPEASI